MSTKITTLICITAVCLGVGIHVRAGEPVPIRRFLEPLPTLVLGVNTTDFIGEYSADELYSARHGIRAFDVRKNTLPESVTSAHCEFKDNKLYYIEIMFGPGTAWAELVAEPTERHGLPGAWAALAGGETAYHDDMTRSAVWKDDHTVLMAGQDEYGNSLLLLTSTDSLVDTLRAVADAAENRRMQEQYSAQRDAWNMEQENAAPPTYTYQGPYEVKITVNIDKDFFFARAGGDPDGSAPDLFIGLSSDLTSTKYSDAVENTYSVTWTTSVSWRPGGWVKLTVTDQDGFLSNTLLAELAWEKAATFPMVGEVRLADIHGAEWGDSTMSFEVLSSPGQN
jgi:hypothetical protein